MDICQHFDKPLAKLGIISVSAVRPARARRRLNAKCAIVTTGSGAFFVRVRSMKLKKENKKEESNMYARALRAFVMLLFQELSFRELSDCPFHLKK